MGSATWEDVATFTASGVSLWMALRRSSHQTLVPALTVHISLRGYVAAAAAPVSSASPRPWLGYLLRWLGIHPFVSEQSEFVLRVVSLTGGLQAPEKERTRWIGNPSVQRQLLYCMGCVGHRSRKCTLDPLCQTISDDATGCLSVLAMPSWSPTWRNCPPRPSGCIFLAAVTCLAGIVCERPTGQLNFHAVRC
jgi:hypothetical protein